jgi:hypothetical protein
MRVLARINSRINLWTVLDYQRVDRIREILNFLVGDSMSGQNLEEINGRRFNFALGKNLPGHLPHELISDLRHSNLRV